jgi:hypothetical protein
MNPESSAGKTHNETSDETLANRGETAAQKKTPPCGEQGSALGKTYISITRLFCPKSIFNAR